MAFNNNSFSSGFGSSNKSRTARKVPIIDQMDAYSQLLQPSQAKKYAEVKKENTSPSWFQKVVSVLTTGESGQAAYDALEGKNPVASYGKSVIDSIQGKGYDKKTYADVLEKLGMKRGALSTMMPWLYNETGKGWKFKKGGFVDPTARGALGLTLDILGDPTTYLGGAGLLKRGIKDMSGLSKYGKGAVEGIEKKYFKLMTEGMDVMDSAKLMEKASEEIATKLKSNPDKYFSGLKFMGKEIVSREKALLPGRYADKLMNHIPILNKTYAGTKDGIQDVFKYGADVLREGKKISYAAEETAEKYLTSKKKFMREADYSFDKFYSSINDVQKNFQDVVSKGDRDVARKYITDKVQTDFGVFGIENLDKRVIDDITETVAKWQDDIYNNVAGSREGLQKDMFAKLNGYMPKIMTPEAKKALAKKNIAKFKKSSVADYALNSDKSSSLLKFVSDDGKVLMGTSKSQGLQPYSKLAEEKFLEKRANRLIKTQQKRINKLNTYVNNLNKKKLKTFLRTGKEIPEQKIASLKTTPKGTKKLTAVGESQQGLRLLREGFSRKDAYKLKTAELKNKETIKFVNALINAPKKEIERIDKLINKIEGKKISNLGKQINDIKKALSENLDELPDANKYFKDRNGKIFTVDRAMSISEVNEDGYFKALMENAGYKGKNFFETDPFAITLARGGKAIKEIERNNFLKNTASKFGIKGDVHKTYNRSDKLRKSRVVTEYSDKWVDDAGKVVDDFTPGAVRYIDPKIKELPEGTLLPEFIVGDLKKTSNAINDDEVIGKVLKNYDSTINKWKSLVYGWFPASHGRNYIGGSFMNFNANPKWVAHTNKVMKTLKGTDDIAKLGEKNIYKNFTFAQWKEELGKRGLFEQSGALDMMDINKSFNNSYWKKAEGIPLKAGTFVESNLRIPLFFSEIADGKTIDEAMSTVYRYHFDYAPKAATDVERKVLKRLIPFYTWQRNAIPLMVEQMIETPGRMSSFYKAIRNADDGSGEIDRSLLPSYLERDPAIMAGGSAISGLGLPPNEVLKFFDNPVDTAISALTPALKIPIELKTNYNTFKDKLITEDKSGEFARNMPQVIKDWLEFEDNSFTDKDGKEIPYARVNPMRKYWLYALPTGRLSSIYGNMTGEREESKLAKFLGGVSSVQTDLDQMKATKEKEYEEKLRDILINAGIYSEYGTAFKSSKEKLQQVK